MEIAFNTKFDIILPLIANFAISVFSIASDLMDSVRAGSNPAHDVVSRDGRAVKA